MHEGLCRRLVAAGFFLLGSTTVHAALPTHAALREELLQMGARDQRIRQATTMVFESEEEFKNWQATDANNQERLKAIVDRYGWPTVSMVGQDGAQAAWLIVQHADNDPDFQRRILSLIEPLTATGEVEPASYAYLYDRTHYPQRYGTQGACVSRQEWQPFEIEDMAGVDARRRTAGLPPLADYVKLFDCAQPNIVLHDPADPKHTVAILETPIRSPQERLHPASPAPIIER